MKTIKFDDVNQGEEIPSIEFGPIKQMDLVRYAGASGDFNPIHTDPTLAKEYGLDGTIAHGMYIMSQLSRVCSNWINPNQVSNYNVKFRGMAIPGETIICTGKIKRKTEKEGKRTILVALQAANSEGDIKVSGDFTVIFI